MVEVEDVESFPSVETHAASALLISSLLVDKVLALEIMDGAKEKELPPPEPVDDSIGARREERISFDGAGEGFGMLEAAVLASGSFSVAFRPCRMS